MVLVAVFTLALDPPRAVAIDVSEPFALAPRAAALELLRLGVPPGRSGRKLGQTRGFKLKELLSFPAIKL